MTRGRRESAVNGTLGGYPGLLLSILKQTRTGFEALPETMEAQADAIADAAADSPGCETTSTCEGCLRGRIEFFQTGSNVESRCFVCFLFELTCCENAER